MSEAVATMDGPRAAAIPGQAAPSAPPEPAETPAAFARKWRRRVRTSEKYFERVYFNRCKKIVERYRDERDNEMLNRAKRFNMLWSNVQTLGPAIYSRQPKPDVSRRYHDADPLSRIASLVLERAVCFETDTGTFGATMVQARDDYLLCARGTQWYRYDPTIESTSETTDPETGEAIAATEELAGETVAVDYVHWRDFVHELKPTWEQVTWVGRRVLMGKEAVVKRFGQQIADRLSYTYRPNVDTGSANRRQMPNDEVDSALIWEVWDKTTKQAIWLSPDIEEAALDVREDPLRLRKFFPCQKPLYATLTTDRLDPVPDYTLYQDQATEIDTLTQRISLLQKALAVRGVYDGANKNLTQLLSERPENFLLPVDNWVAFAEKGGLKGQISFVPIDQIAEVLQSLMEQRNALKQDVYEITGISDIIRGVTAASETATAQQIKGNYAGLRISDRRKAVEEFAGSGLQIMAEIISEHFEPETLREMSGFDQITEVVSLQKEQGGEAVNNLFSAVVALLRNDRMRTFRIDVETDSLIQADQQQDQQNRTQFLEAAGGFLNQALPIMQVAPQFGPLFGQMLMFGVRGFGNVSRELESAFEEAMESLQQNPPPPPPPKGTQRATPGVGPDGGPTPDAILRAQSENNRTNLDAQTAQSEAEMQQVKSALDKYKTDTKFKLEWDKLLLKYGVHPLQRAGVAPATPPQPAKMVQ